MTFPYTFAGSLMHRAAYGEMMYILDPNRRTEVVKLIEESTDNLVSRWCSNPIFCLIEFSFLCYFSGLDIESCNIFNLLIEMVHLDQSVNGDLKTVLRFINFLDQSFLIRKLHWVSIVGINSYFSLILRSTLLFKINESLIALGKN